MKAFPTLLAFACLCAVACAANAEGVDPPRAFFGTYCLKCHGPETQEGDFRVDTMLKVSETPGDAEYWQAVLHNLHLGKMPPEGEKQPTAAEVEPVTTWIAAELQRARRVLVGHAGEVVLRRLNRTEYEYTIEDLFGVRGDFADGFPADAAEDGFNNNGAALVLSAEQINQYVQAATFVLDRAIVTSPRPETKLARFTLRDIQKLADRKLAGQNRRPPYFPTYGDAEDALIVVRYTKPNTRDFFRVREPGWYRFKVSAYAVRNNGQPVRLQVSHGKGVPTEVPTIVDVIQLTDDKPQQREYRVYLQPNFRVELEMLDGTNWLPGDKIEDSRDVAVAIRSMEIEGPLHEQWPPRGHRLLLGTRDASRLDDAEMPAVLAELAPKLFRRPVETSVVQEYVDFYADARRQQLAPLDAFRLTAKAMMASPHFLYHVEPGKTPDDYALANRLSYFLWRSAPDDELYRLAADGKLGEPEILRRQVDRLLADAKSERFLHDFVGQWLGIDKVGEMQPDANLYPEYDRDLERAMVAETESFIHEMLHKDLPLSNLVDSDWAMLNDRLARHYGIDGVRGNDIRRVALDKAETIRGGLLAQASILNITSNGTTTSPVVRGAWILEKLLGTPPAPPPPDVPAIEPDIRGASTIQQQLERHRTIPQCASCHRKIDPYGIALENFDVIGGWREKYRALEPTANPNRPKLVDGPTVISSDSLPRQGPFDDFRAFRELLRKQEPLVTQNMARQLATFALGRSLDFADEADLEQIVAATKSGGGMKTMLHALVAGEMFRRP